MRLNRKPNDTHERECISTQNFPTKLHRNKWKLKRCWKVYGLIWFEANGHWVAFVKVNLLHELLMGIGVLWGWGHDRRKSGQSGLRTSSFPNRSSLEKLNNLDCMERHSSFFLPYASVMLPSMVVML